jgi:uncharacterized protein (PEP-CTERM system associated)
MTSRGSDGPLDRPRAPPRPNAFPAPPARPAITALLAALLTLAAAPSAAQNWRIEPAFSAQETLTNNVNLVTSDSRRSDWVTQLTPSLRVTEKGARTSLVGFLSLPVLLYARTGNENNNAYPSADLLGDIALVENWLHVEGQITISQQYFNPFGGQPLGLDNATQNRYESDTYRLSPYVKGVTPGHVSYELRNNNVWTNVNNTPVTADDFRYTQFKGNAAQAETTVGWQADFDVNDVTVNNRDKFRSRLVRLQPVYKVDPQLKLVATVGYEENHFPSDESNNAVYGGAFEWHPTPRTNVTGSLEHRFFGAGYLFSFDHRTPLSVWTLRVSRNNSSFPQQLANLPAGGDVSALLNNLFLTTIPDPALRQQAIDQFIRDRGLPSVLSSPLNLYSQQVFLQQSQTASVGLLGTRNTVVLTLFNVRSQPISASGEVLTLPVNFGDNSRQTGISLLWSHKLTPAVVVDATIERFRTVANSPLEGKTNQTAVRVAVSTPLSAKTTMFGGARYQTLSSDVATDYNEAAAFIGVTYTFR